MAKYVVLLTGDENVWERATPEEKAEIYGFCPLPATAAPTMTDRTNKAVEGMAEKYDFMISWETRTFVGSNRALAQFDAMKRVARCP